MKKLLPMFIGLLSVSSLFVSNQLRGDECQNIVDQAEVAYGKQDVPRMKQLHATMAKSNTDCDAAQKYYVHFNLAHLMYQQLAISITASKEKAEIKASKTFKGLKEILNVWPHYWPALVDMAEHYRSQGKYDEASYYYDLALLAINDESLTDDVHLPDSRKIQELYFDADYVIAGASESFLPSNRGGESFRVRGVNAKSRHVPIHFGYNKAGLQGRDKKLADGLYDSLKNAGSPDITLIGHTDPKGSEIYNWRLGKKRATTVQHYLKSKGYSGEIVVESKGELQPLRSRYRDPLNQYGEDKWYQMLRRVEVKPEW